MNIYVGNLAYSATDEELRSAFEEFGAVNSVKIIRDHATGRSRGFAFVQMEDHEAGRIAVSQLNGSELRGRPLVVNEARAPRTMQRSNHSVRATKPFRQFRNRTT
ncbi:MAG: RNA-binding protein [Turneriella sp.]|nr:RNA-binding protein [Turneriella sp.]